MLGKNLLANVAIDRILGDTAAGQAATSTDILDMEGYEGVLFIAKLGDVTNASVVTLQAYQDTDAAGGTMAALSGTVTYTAAAADVDDDLLILDVYRPQKRYVKAVLTSGTADAVKNGVIAIRYGARKGPITQGSTVLDSDTLISPAEA